MMHASRLVFGLLGAAAIAVGYACGGDGFTADPGTADGGTGSSSGGSSGASSSGSSGTSSSGGTDDGGVTGPGCGQAACTGIAGMCGTITDGCGQPVTCEPCRWTSDTVTSSFDVDHVAIASTGPGVFVIAVDIEGVINFGTKAAGGWQLERAAPDLEAGALSMFGDLHLAMAPDGTPWIVFVHSESGTYKVSVAHRTNGTWTTETVANGFDASIAVASDGTPYVGFVGTTPQGYGAAVARRTGGAWTERTLVAQSNYVRDQQIALNGTEARIAWYDATAMAVRHAVGTPGAAFTVEDVATGVNSSGTTIEVDIAIDPAGKSRVVYSPYSSGTKFASRDQTWTVDPDFSGQRGQVRLANMPNDGVAIAMLDSIGDTIGVAFRRGSWSKQAVHSDCQNNAALDLAVDSAGTTAIINTCKYNTLAIWTQTGIYPPGYKVACESLGKALCDPGCACPRADDGKCCIIGEGSTRCTGPATYCPSSWTQRYCGSALVNPADVFACQAAAPGTMCTPDGGVGAVEPLACAPLRQ